MKKLVLFAAMVALGVTSCSKDDDNKQAELAGKWEYAQDGVFAMGQEILTTYDHTPGCTKDYMMITTSTIADHTFSGASCFDETSTDAYTLNGNKITMVIDGQTYTQEVVLLNATTLKLKANMDDEGVPASFITVFTRK